MDPQTETKLINDVGKIKGTVEGLAGAVREHITQVREDKREAWAAIERTRERTTRHEAEIEYLNRGVDENEADIKAIAGRSGGKLGALAGTGMAGLLIGVIEYIKSFLAGR